MSRPVFKLFQEHIYYALQLAYFCGVVPALRYSVESVLRDHHYLTGRPDVPPLEAMKPIIPRLQGLTEEFIRPEVVSQERGKSQALYERYFP